MCIRVAFYMYSVMSVLLFAGGMRMEIPGEAHCSALCCLCASVDALSHSDDVTSFQGVVQHKQAWPDLSQLRSCGQFSVKEDWTRAFLRSRADLGAHTEHVWRS